MAEYCDVHFSWSGDIDHSRIVTYAQCEDNESMGGSLQDLPPCLPGCLELTQNSTDDTEAENCMMTITCKPVYCVKLQGIAMVSESRTVELYDQTRGYLQTERGRAVDAEDGDSPKLYQCTCMLDDPVREVSVKFLSLGDRTSFKIRLVHLLVCQSNHSPSSVTSSGAMTIETDKLRSFVEGMGDKVSPKALSLLDTMEQYKKNQSDALEDVRTMLSQSSLPQEKQTSLSGMMGLMSSFSRFSSSSFPAMSKPNPLDSATLPSPSGGSNFLSSMLTAAQDRKNGDSPHAEDIYGLMQSICGQVTKMRQIKTAPAPAAVRTEQPDTDTESAEIPPTSEMEERIKQHVQVAEKRIMEHVDVCLEQMEARITRKLDIVLSLLQSTQSSSGQEQNLRGLRQMGSVGSVGQEDSGAGSELDSSSPGSSESSISCDQPNGHLNGEYSHRSQAIELD